MDAHRIDVLDGADDDAVVRAVANHLHLELLPAEQALVYQDLRHGRGVETGAADPLVILAVVGDAAAGSSHGEGRADDGGQTDVFDGGHRLGHRIGDGGLGVLEADAVHRLAEELAVLGHLDGGAFGADQLDAESGEHAHVVERQRGVQPRLAAHRRQERVGAFLFDDLGDDVGGDRLDIGGVGHAGIGHDRGGVGIDQNDPVALLAERLAGLGAGIVEFAGLSDDDGPRSDDHDGADVGSFRHDRPCISCPASRGRRSGWIRRGWQIGVVIEAGVRGARARRPGPQLIVDALPGGASFASDDAFICEREDGAPLGLGAAATLAFDGITPSQVAQVLSAAGSVRFPPAIRHTCPDRRISADRDTAWNRQVNRQLERAFKILSIYCVS